ncbi:hypothetical protein H2203_006623 [Taxawa tesnikishii (nom. ined.)]|nr:hypothetical protein H2203_006623 [Dothideales sp. JES 119]
MSSPPLTPIRQFIPTLETSPNQRRTLSRRSSSFSNNRSPITPRSNYSAHRLSGASHYSNGNNDLGTPLGGPGGGGMGMGNLADELGFADEDGWDDEGLDEGIGHMSMADELDNSQPAQDKDMHTEEHDGQIFQDPPQNDGARDSGIDVEYTSSPAAPPIRNFSYGPFVQSPKIQSTRSQRSRPTSKAGSQEQPDAFSFELEDAMNAVARLADPQHQQQADTIARTVSALQDLAPQVTLESQTQRLTTSTNSLSSNLMRQTKLLASLSSSVFSPFALTAPLDAVDIDEILPTLFEILKDLPLPDARALQGLAKLDRETGIYCARLRGCRTRCRWVSTPRRVQRGI